MWGLGGRNVMACYYMWGLLGNNIRLYYYVGVLMLLLNNAHVLLIQY